MDFHIFWQRKQLSFNSSDQLCVVSSRKIGPSDASVEKRIAYNDLIGGNVIEANAARRMPRRMDHMQLQRTDLYHIAMLKKYFRFCHFARVETVGSTIARNGIQYRHIALVHFQLQVVLVRQELIPQHMIHMAVRIQQFYGLQPFFFDEVGQLFPLMFIGTTGIDDGAVLLVIPNEVGVLLKRIENKLFQMHGREDMEPGHDKLGIYLCRPNEEAVEDVCGDRLAGIGCFANSSG